MDVLARMVGTIVADSLKADDEMREMMNLKESESTGNNKKGEWDIHRKSVQMAVRTLLKSLSQDENWMVTQAKRKREKEDVFKQNPSMDPVFMKV